MDNLKRKFLFVFVMLICSINSIYSQIDVCKLANFKRYAIDNQSLLEDSASVGKVVFLGNSITEQWMKYHPDFFVANGYINRGIGGQTSYQFLLRFREDVIKLSPKVVVINAATNDIAENTGPYNEEYTYGNIISMIELACANGIRVILTSTLPAIGFQWNAKIKDAPLKIVSLNKRLKDYAESHNIAFVDYYKSLVNRNDDSLDSGYTKDGVHPTLAGFKVMESLIKPVIEAENIKNQ